MLDSGPYLGQQLLENLRWINRLDFRQDCVLVCFRFQIPVKEVAPVAGDLVCSEWGFDEVSEFAWFDVVLFWEDLVTWADFLSQCSGDAVWVGFVEEDPDVVAFFAGEFGQERNA